MTIDNQDEKQALTCNNQTDDAQLPIDNRQSSIDNRQSSIDNRQSSIDNHQSSIANHQSSILKILHRIEDSILVGLLSLMIGLAVAQIFLRNLFDAGFLWGDVLVRILVLWIGLAGAMVASRDGKHINIDIVTRYLPVKVKKIVNCVIELFTGVICTIAAWYGLKFVQMEYQYGGQAFANIPVWLCESIIPFAFTVIAVRYFVLSFMSFKSAKESLK